jgi:hypothetical protein
LDHVHIGTMHSWQYSVLQWSTCIVGIGTCHTLHHACCVLILNKITIVIAITFVMVEFMCAEPRCGLRFVSPQKYEIHWTASHKTKPRQRCPRCVTVKPLILNDVKKGDRARNDYTDNKPDCNGFIRVIDAISTSMQIPITDAKCIYKNTFRHPDVVERGYLSHRFDSKTRETTAVILNKDWDDFFSLIKLISKPVGGVQHVAVAKKFVMTTPSLIVKKKKRVHCDISMSDDSVYTHIPLIENIRSKIESYSKTVTDINKMDCDDLMKDILRYETAKAIGCTKDYEPVVVIGNLVHEHLGYSPTVLSRDISSQLLMSIGRTAKLQYMTRHGMPPKRRKYSSNGVVLETNNYSNADRVWIDRIVREECVKIGVYPRPRASMARGEKVIM